MDKEQILEMLGIDRKGNSSSVLWTIGLFALGVVAGATGALLLAPKNGREFRDSFVRNIKKTADDLLNSTKAKAKDIQADLG